SLAGRRDRRGRPSLTSGTAAAAELALSFAALADGRAHVAPVTPRRAGGCDLAWPAIAARRRGAAIEQPVGCTLRAILTALTAPGQVRLWLAEPGKHHRAGAWLFSCACAFACACAPVCRQRVEAAELAAMARWSERLRNRACPADALIQSNNQD